MTTEVNENFWKKCSSCKNEIPYKGLYWVCNVSTCNRKRTGLVFCNVSCWDAHVPMMNHRDTWAEERKAPSKDQWIQILKEEEMPKKRGPRAVEVKVEEVETPKVSSAPRVLLRKASGS